MTFEDLAAEKDRRIGQLEAENLRLRLSAEIGVPASLLGDASTEAGIRAAADAALAWKAATAALPPSRPQTSALPASTVTSGDRIAMAAGQVTSRDQLARLSPAERLRAWREDRLTTLGVAQPPPSHSTPIDR
jgi:hypothetical protein